MTRAHQISTADRGTPTLAARAGSRIAKAWHAYWTLRDIGVGRDEIPSVVYGRHGDRTRCYDASWRLWQASR